MITNISNYFLLALLACCILLGISSCAPIQPPLACINISNPNLNRGDTVTFSSCGRASNYEWDFGDGKPNSYTAKPMHIYTDSGTFNVFLTVWMNGKADQTSISVKVY